MSWLDRLIREVTHIFWTIALGLIIIIAIGWGFSFAIDAIIKLSGGQP